MGTPVIAVEHLGKQYKLGKRKRVERTFREAVSEALTAPFRRGRSAASGPDGGGPFWALRDVSFTVGRGEVVGIIGANGAGKSTLLKVLSRITPPTTGKALIRGRVGSLLEVGTGFHRELTGRENIYLNGAILGMQRSEIRRKFDEIVAFAEIDDFIDTPVKYYSSGMYVRLAFAVAAHLDTEILLVDEVLAVGDLSFQNKCLGKMGDVVKQGRTILFVSHNMAAIQRLCSHAFLIARGSVRYAGDVETVINGYIRQFDPAHRPRHTVLAQDPARTVELISVQPTDESGRPVSVIQSGRNVTLCLTLRTARPIPRAAASIGIDSLHGVRVTVLHSGIAGRALALPAGESRILCRVPRFPLLTGHYFLDVNLMSGTEILIAAPYIEQIRVEDGDFYRTGKVPDPRWGGFVHLAQSWTSATVQAHPKGADDDLRTKAQRAG